MHLAMASNYVSSRGDASPHLLRLSEAGFTHVQWCHEWDTDHLYSPDEMTAIGRTLSDLGLRLLSLHASHGVAHSWGALDENRRRAGQELVENRIVMAASLSSSVVVLRVPEAPAGSVRRQRFREALNRSLAGLEPVARRHGVRIALENSPADDFSDIRELFARHAPEFLGLCYDSGHGNIGGKGLEHLERNKDRLIAVDLHDNDGAFDLHGLPFTGTVDWPRLAQLIRTSTYRGCVSLKTFMRDPSADLGSFLADARASGQRLARLISDPASAGGAA